MLIQNVPDKWISLDPLLRKTEYFWGRCFFDRFWKRPLFSYPKSIVHFLCQHYQLDKKRSAVKGPLILEFTFCFVEQVLGMSTLFHFLYHQPTKTPGVPLLCFHSTHVNMTKKTTITITTFNSLEECFIRILPWHSTGMYGTPDINTDKFSLRADDN